MKNILVLIDIQKEYVTEGRPFYLQGIESSLAKCENLLTFARNNAWEVIHVQHSNGKGAPRFNPDTEYYGFIDGFSPLPNEKVYVKSDFSCYSNVNYADYMDSMVKSGEEYKIHLIGYNSVMCCLSTMEEARRKGHKIHFVEDASYAKALENKTELESHQLMVALYKAKGLAVITNYASIIQLGSAESLFKSSIFSSQNVQKNAVNLDSVSLHFKKK